MKGTSSALATGLLATIVIIVIAAYFYTGDTEKPVVTLGVTPTTATPICGDGFCAGEKSREDCNTCPVDCPGIVDGQPRDMYCCGNDKCEKIEKTMNNCPVDCGKKKISSGGRIAY